MSSAPVLRVGAPAEEPWLLSKVSMRPSWPGYGLVDAEGFHPSEADYRHQDLAEHLDHRADRPRRVECCAAPPAPPGPNSAHRARSLASHSCSTPAAQPRAPNSSISTMTRAASPPAPLNNRSESQRSGAPPPPAASHRVLVATRPCCCCYNVIFWECRRFCCDSRFELGGNYTKFQIGRGRHLG